MPVRHQQGGGPTVVADAPEPVAADESLTIDELARTVGMTVRNLREWRALGLLPAPTMRGRTGYYGPPVVERIAAIQRLHAEGFTLELIRRLLEASGDHAPDAMAFAEALRAPFREDDPPLVDLDRLRERWGANEDDHLRRAIELGLIRTRDDGRLEHTSARVAEVGEQLHRLGLSAGAVLDATEAIRSRLDEVAAVFEDLWLRQVWEPWVAEGMPADRQAEISRTLADVQPLALDAVVGLFAVAMDERITQGIEREVRRALGQR